MRNKYGFFADIGRDTITFPVNPKDYAVSYPTDHATYNILDAGEVILPRPPSLMTITWESYFPGDGSDPLMQGRDWTEPGGYVEAIKAAMDGKRVCDLVISRYDAVGRRMYDTNVSAVITNFETTEKGGEAGDVYYKIAWSEYRPFGPIRVRRPDAGTDANGAPAIPEAAPRGGTAPALCVGANVVADGAYYSSSYGDKPAGNANGLETTVTRIIPDPGRPFPVLIGGNRGWLRADQLRTRG